MEFDEYLKFHSIKNYNNARIVISISPLTCNGGLQFAIKLCILFISQPHILKSRKVLQIIKLSWKGSNVLIWRLKYIAINIA